MSPPNRRFRSALVACLVVALLSWAAWLVVQGSGDGAGPALDAPGAQGRTRGEQPASGLAAPEAVVTRAFRDEADAGSGRRQRGLAVHTVIKGSEKPVVGARVHLIDTSDFLK